MHVKMMAHYKIWGATYHRFTARSGVLRGAAGTELCRAAAARGVTGPRRRLLCLVGRRGRNVAGRRAAAAGGGRAICVENQNSSARAGAGGRLSRVRQYVWEIKIPSVDQTGGVCNFLLAGLNTGLNLARCRQRDEGGGVEGCKA